MTEQAESSASMGKAERIKHHAVAGLSALVLRTMGTLVLRLGTSFVLARLLFPSDYGVYGVVAYLSGLGMYLGDLGLSASLVRMEKEPTQDERATVFWFHQGLTATIVLGLIVGSPMLVRAYGLSSDAALVLTVMSASLFLSSLRVLPMITLERQLRFGVIARCELIESLVQAVIVVVLAYGGWGAWAFAIAGVVRSLVGLVMLLLAAPAALGGRFRLSLLQSLGRFGIGFQLNVLVPTLAGGWMPYFLTRMVGSSGLGLANWAYNIGSVPLSLASVLNRIAFPAYSRLQSDEVAFGRYMQGSIKSLGALLWTLIPLAVLSCPLLIHLVYGPRWEPATSLVQWFSIEVALITMNGLMAAAHVACGEIYARLGITSTAALLRWGLGYYAVAKWGLLGVGPAMCLCSLIELLLSSIAVRRRYSHSNGLYMVVFSRLAINLGLLGFVMGITHRWGLKGIAERTLVSLLEFTLLLCFLEALTRGQIVFRELRRVYHMLWASRRAMTAEAAI